MFHVKRQGIILFMSHKMKNANAEGMFGLAGFLSPSLFLLQKIYINSEKLKDTSN